MNSKENGVPVEPALQVRVAEARTKDVGRGLIRLDPKDIEEIGASVGDIVQITGQRETVARVMPAFAADRGKKVIQMDGVIRSNCGAGLDELVQVECTSATTASSITLVGRNGLKNSQARYLSRSLDGIPVVLGDQVRVKLIGSRVQHYKVKATRPKGAVLIGPETQFKLEKPDGNATERSAFTYEDIGGLSDELRKIREMVELPLRFPEVFEHLGIDAPKGVLLYGPPGTGKTLIARAVAHETSASFFQVNGPEVIDKMYGASEAQLRKLFEKASQQAPAIIFIDELDAIAPKRDSLSGDRQVERRVVAQLLALMDGLNSRGDVIVVAATNLPDSLDPALRRPGRFDREIMVGVPDKDGRKHILEIHSRGMPISDHVDLEQVAAKTHGFVGADLAATCREAAMHALRRIIPSFSFSVDQVPYEQLVNLEVTPDDFQSALSEIEPSAIREVFTDTPDVSWDDIGGLEDVKNLLVETVQWPIQHRELFDQYNTAPPKGILLYGPPGTGKTLLAKAVAKESGVNFISIKGPELLTKWIGEPEKKLREVFKKARMAAPCIVFFDEIDALVPVRGGGGSSQVSERVVNQFLSEMDGVEELHGVMILAATNRIDLIDPALLRPGRIEINVALPLPDADSRKAIFDVHTRGIPLGDDITISELVEKTEGMTGADIAGVCRHASLAAIRSIVKGANTNGASEERSLKLVHFQRALSQFHAAH